jgi:hypothetical protein
LFNNSLVEQLVLYFQEKLISDGDILTYVDILRDTGIDIRAQSNIKGYQISVKAREYCTKLPDPFMVEVLPGEGVTRVRIGRGSHLKSLDYIGRIRRISRKAIYLNNIGLRHAEDDEEAVSIRSQNVIHSGILSRCHAEEYRSQYAVISNGVQPTRVFMGLRDVLRKSRGINS